MPTLAEQICRDSAWFVREHDQLLNTVLSIASCFLASLSFPLTLVVLDV